jgi:putative ABC transport system substrate-binding protein
LAYSAARRLLGRSLCAPNGSMPVIGFLNGASYELSGVVVSQDGLFYAARKVIADLALARKLPLAVYYRETLDAGALLSYGPSNYRIFHASGAYIDKIAKGAKPADLPVEQPTKFEFIINLKTARSIGIDVPPMLLTRADEVIE